MRLFNPKVHVGKKYGDINCKCDDYRTTYEIDDLETNMRPLHDQYRELKAEIGLNDDVIF